MLVKLEDVKEDIKEIEELWRRWGDREVEEMEEMCDLKDTRGHMCVSGLAHTVLQEWQ